MSSAEIIAAKNTLHEIALHAHNLAMGLQNAAPPQVKEAGSPTSSVQYLFDTAVQLEKTSQAISAMLEES